MKTLNTIIIAFWVILCSAQPNSTYPQIPLTEFLSVDLSDDNIVAQATEHINKYVENAPSSTNDLTEDKTLHVWPNPIDKNAPLQINSDWDQLRIIDLNGRVVSRYSAFQSSIDIQNIESGVCLIQSIYQGKTKVAKLMVF